MGVEGRRANVVTAQREKPDPMIDGAKASICARNRKIMHLILDLLG